MRVDLSEPLEVGKNGFQPQALVLTRGKELCTQTHMIAKRFESAFPGIQISVGDPANLTNAHVLFCTPGNLLTLISKRQLDLSKLKLFAIDEADYVMTNEMGNNAVLAVAKTMTNKEQQFLFFSATYEAKALETIKLIKKI